MTTLRELCHEWLASLPTWRQSARPGGGLTATVVTRHLLYPAVQERWSSAPTLNARLSAKQVETALATMRWLGKGVERRLHMLRVAIDDAVTEARARDVEVTVTLLGDKLVRAVHRLEAAGEPISDTELAAVASTYLDNRPPRGRMLSRDEFAQYEPRFLRLWERTGACHVAEFRPSSLGLGDDERPPFVRKQRENTWDGLGRSVYSRFLKTAGDARVAGTSHQIARLEIRRACGRVGLKQEPALVALHSLALGITLGPFDRGNWLRPQAAETDESWKVDKGALKQRDPVSKDLRLPRGPWVHADMAAYAQASVAKFVAQEQQGRYLRMRGLMHTAREHAMRRAWMICFEHDRRGVIIDGRAGARIVSLSIYKGIPSGQAFLRKRRLLATQEAKRPVPPTIDPDRLQATLAWLAEDRDLVEGLFAGDQTAVAGYEELVISHGLVPLRILLDYFGKDL